MRAYFFQNFYLQGIHAGIQSQHTTAEMFVKYTDESYQQSMLFEWATKHKTTIVLNGGTQKDLKDIVFWLELLEQFPFAYFNESDDCLNGALTNVGVILPEYIYSAPRTDSEEWWEYSKEFTPFEKEFIRLLQTKRLMT